MPLIRKPIPSLINGVSQQAAALRLSSQCEVLQNGYPSVVRGLQKRPPSQFIAKLSSGTLGDAFIHTINRDTNERYIVIITQNTINVYELDGTPVTVNTPSGTGYLNIANPSERLRATTIADFTFIADSQKTIEMDSATLSDTNASSGIVFVKQAVSSRTYNIIVNGTQQATYTAGSSDGTVDIATDLASDLTTNLGAGWTIERVHSTIKITKDDGTDFTLSIEDDGGGEYMKMAKEKVQDFNDLPTQCFNDFILQITGQPDSEYDNYYVKFETDDSGATSGPGVWVETVAPGIEYQFDQSTMPHTLVRNSGGTFDFDEASWGGRSAGDADSAPDPSFVGNGISDIFLFKNRLCVLSRDKVIMSRASEFFEFFPESVSLFLDSNPIDVTASHNKVSFLRHAIPFNEQLLLISDQTQFIVPKTDILTAKTIAINPTTEIETADVAPVGIGRNVYFANEVTAYANIYEYFITDDSERNDALDVTAHVPQYIPRGVKKMVNIGKDHLVTLTTGASNKLYLYKFYFGDNNQKLQSAHCEWVFDENCEILNIDSIGEDLYIVVQYPDGVYLEKINISYENDPGLEYITHLDRRITEAECTSVTYDSGTNETTFVLPYTPNGVPFIATRAGGVLPEGVLVNIKSSSTNTLVVSGDYSTEPVYLGIQYEFNYRFSQFYLKQSKQNGNEVLTSDGRLQITNLRVRYEDTGFFQSEVTPNLRNTSIKYFTGRIVGSGNNLIGEVPLESGLFNIMVQSKNDQVIIELKNNSILPSNFLAAEWEGYINPRAKGV